MAEVKRLTDSRKLLLVFVAIAAASLTLGFFGSKIIKSPAQVAADAKAPKATLLTATVESGTVQQSVVLRGKIKLGKTVQIAPQLPDGVKPIVTDKSVRRGESVLAGSSVMEIAYRPLFLLPGRIPMIRDLRPGMSGQDVAQLQAGLRQVGWPVYDARGYFGKSTGAALSSLYRSAGYAYPTELPASGDAQSSVDPGSGTSDNADTDSEGASKEKKAVPVLVAKQSEIAFAEGLPGRVTRYGAAIGHPITGVAVTIATSDPAVSASSDPSDAKQLRKGMKVSVSGPDAALNFAGRITSIGEPQQSDETQGFVTPVSVAPQGDVPLSMVGKDVQISVDLSKEAKKGLIVPLSAIYSGQDGATTVSKVVGSQRVVVAVRVEDSGEGLAQIVGVRAGSVRVGDKLVVGVS